MKIRDLLSEEKILTDLKSNSKEDALKEMAAFLVSQPSNDKLNLNLQQLTEKLIEREKLSSTGIGDGIAIPHCKYRNVNGILMLFGRSAVGIDFDSIDKKPVNLFFLLVANDTSKAAGDHLRTLAKITRILKNADLRRNLMLAQTQKEIYQIIAKEDEKY